MVEKKIMIDGKLVPFKASAAIPRIYRAKFGSDIFGDMMKLCDIGNGPEGKKAEIADLELFENVAYIMAKHADPSQPDTPEEWLDQFSTFSIYEVLPKLLDLWKNNVKTDVKSKKKRRRAAGR